MSKRRNPGAGKLQGFGINRVCDKPIHTVACIDVQPEFNVVARLARRSGVDPITIKAQLEVWQIGGLS